MVPVAGWKETQVSDMDFDTIMEKAYEEYFEGLAEGEEALSFSEFKQALRIRMCSHNDAEHKYEKQNQTAENFVLEPGETLSVLCSAHTDCLMKMSSKTSTGL